MESVPSSWKIVMLLADNAQAVGGKLYILGGGWSVTGPASVPFAIALKIEVPWEAANRKHQLRLQLLDSDGRPPMIPGPSPDPPSITADIEVGRPAGIPAGTPLDAIFAINLPPIHLASGRYEWRCTIGEGSASCAFTVRA
jgi:hypothetical protein